MSERWTLTWHSTSNSKRGLYETVGERLGGAGFTPDANDRGNPTRQRWRPDSAHPDVGIDFLVQPTRPGDQGGRLRNLQPDFATVIVPGLHVAFLTLCPWSRRDDDHGRKRKPTRPGGPGALVLLKALAFRNRARRRAYDLYLRLAVLRVRADYALWAHDNLGGWMAADTEGKDATLPIIEQLAGLMASLALNKCLLARILRVSRSTVDELLAGKGQSRRTTSACGHS